MLLTGNVGHGGRQTGGANSAYGPGQISSGIIDLPQAVAKLQHELLVATDANKKLKARVRELQTESTQWRETHKDVEHYIASLVEELNLKNQELLKLAPYGSYSVSGPNPYLLQKTLQRVSHALHAFVLSIRIPAGKPSSDLADLSKDEALVSSIFFSKFERVDLGVMATFIPPAQVPELSFQEYKAFDSFMDDQEDDHNKAAMGPYWGRFNAFYQMMGRLITGKVLRPCGMSVNEESHVRFWNLAMCVWMLHKLFLSFDKAHVTVMRVRRGEEFNREFMNTVPGRQDELEEHTLGAPLVVEYLVLPGLWINGSVFKCYVFLASPPHREVGPANQHGAVNGTDQQPQDMGNGVETLVPSEEHPGNDTLNKTNQSQDTGNGVETLVPSEEHLGVDAVNGTGQPQDMDSGLETLLPSKEHLGIDATNATEQPQNTDSGVETLVPFEESPAIDAVNWKDQQPQDMGGGMESNLPSEESLAIGAENGTDQQPQDMGKGVDTLVPREESLAIDAQNGTDQQPQDMGNVMGTLVPCEERQATGTSPIPSFVMGLIVSTLVRKMPNFLWKAVVIYLQSLSRGQTCLEYRLLIRDGSASPEPPEPNTQRGSLNGTSPGPELNMAAEVSHPPTSCLNNDTQAESSDGGVGTSLVCENTQIFQVDGAESADGGGPPTEDSQIDGVQGKLETSPPQDLLPAAADSQVSKGVPGIGFHPVSQES